MARLVRWNRGFLSVFVQRALARLLFDLLFGVRAEDGQLAVDFQPAFDHDEGGLVNLVALQCTDASTLDRDEGGLANPVALIRS